MSTTSNPAPASAPVDVAVEVDLGGGRLRTRLRVLDAPAPPSQLLPLIRSVCDTVIGHTTQRLVAQGRPVSCQPGCAACCSYLVPVTRSEARRLLALVNGMPAQQAAEVRARFAQLEARASEAGLLDTLRDFHRLSAAEQAPLGDAYFALGQPCPFLVDNLCSIYAERPLLCREYLVVSPAERCGQVPSPAVEAVRLPVEPAMALARLDQEGEGADAPGWVILGLALRFAEEAAAGGEDEPLRPAPEQVRRYFAALNREV